MNYGELKSELRARMFPSGEQENLIGVHDGFFQEALYDLQDAIECLRFGNSNVFPHCASYFNCGMTVLPLPRGHILKLYVIDKLNPETGLEDAEADDDWCSKRYYSEVEYCHIQSFIRLCQRCSGTSNPSVADALVAGLFGVYRNKSRYPAPTDEGLESLPKLPQGFHYPQTSTDVSGRSPGGVWAKYRGRIYIAPWIQSTETVVIEWNGIKRLWNDADLVDDDPKFKQAVRIHVAMQHARDCDNDMQAYGILKGEWNTIRADLMHECREETRVRTCNEVAGSGSGARGLGATDLATAQFYNDRQQYVANCPIGTMGSPVTAIVEAGTVGSALSKADANAKALQQAADNANVQIICDDTVATYLSTAQTYTAQCPGATDDTPAAVGNSVTVTIPAGAYTSSVSQVAADAAALAAATAQASASLVCTYYNAEQTYTASCPTGSVGDDVEATVAASAHSSTVSQQEANQLALIAAQADAESQLSCSADAHMIGNTPQTVPRTLSCSPQGCQPRIFSKIVTVGADTFVKQTTAANEVADQLALNQQAQDYARMQADQYLQFQCFGYTQTCNL